MSAMLKSCQQLVILVCLTIALTGCVRYETTINFFSFNAGELVQQIALDRQFYQLNQAAADAWLKSIEQRTHSLHGQVQKKGTQELRVVIPFRQAAELVKKFNQFFASDQQLLSSQLAITTNNFLLVSRHQLAYDLDLRSLAADRNFTGSMAGTPALDLKFGLNVPQLPFNLNHGSSWQLQPGQVNHLNAVFWLPQPLGIGGLVIGLLVAIGYFIKSKL